MAYDPWAELEAQAGGGSMDSTPRSEPSTRSSEEDGLFMKTISFQKRLVDKLAARALGDTSENPRSIGQRLSESLFTPEPDDSFLEGVARGGIGMATDIATDPLTWELGGLGKVAGFLGKASKLGNVAEAASLLNKGAEAAPIAGRIARGLGDYAAYDPAKLASYASTARKAQIGAGAAFIPGMAVGGYQGITGGIGALQQGQYGQAGEQLAQGGLSLAAAGLGAAHLAKSTGAVKYGKGFFDKPIPQPEPQVDPLQAANLRATQQAAAGVTPAPEMAPAAPVAVTMPLAPEAVAAPEPAIEPAIEAAPPVAAAPPTRPKLQAGISGAKPKYSYGPNQFDLSFESDLDRAAYITAQGNRSKADASYLQFVIDNTGLSEADVRAHGVKIKAQLKAMAARGQHGDTLTIPDSGLGPKAPVEAPYPSMDIEDPRPLEAPVEAASPAELPETPAVQQVLENENAAAQGQFEAPPQFFDETGQGVLSPDGQILEPTPIAQPVEAPPAAPAENVGQLPLDFAAEPPPPPSPLTAAPRQEHRPGTPFGYTEEGQGQMFSDRTLKRKPNLPAEPVSGEPLPTEPPIGEQLPIDFNPPEPPKPAGPLTAKEKAQLLMDAVPPGDVAAAIQGNPRDINNAVRQLSQRHKLPKPLAMQLVTKALEENPGLIAEAGKKKGAEAPAALEQPPVEAPAAPSPLSGIPNLETLRGATREQVIAKIEDMRKNLPQSKPDWRPYYKALGLEPSVGGKNLPNNYAGHLLSAWEKANKSAAPPGEGLISRVGHFLRKLFPVAEKSEGGSEVAHSQIADWHKRTATSLIDHFEKSGILNAAQTSRLRRTVFSSEWIPDTYGESRPSHVGIRRNFLNPVTVLSEMHTDLRNFFLSRSTSKTDAYGQIVDYRGSGKSPKGYLTDVWTNKDAFVKDYSHRLFATLVHEMVHAVKDTPHNLQRGLEFAELEKIFQGAITSDIYNNAINSLKGSGIDNLIREFQNEARQHGESAGSSTITKLFDRGGEGPRNLGALQNPARAVSGARAGATSRVDYSKVPKKEGVLSRVLGALDSHFRAPEYKGLPAYKEKPAPPKTPEEFLPPESKPFPKITKQENRTAALDALDARGPREVIEPPVTNPRLKESGLRGPEAPATEPMAPANKIAATLSSLKAGETLPTELRKQMADLLAADTAMGRETKASLEGAAKRAAARTRTGGNVPLTRERGSLAHTLDGSEALAAIKARAAEFDAEDAADPLDIARPPGNTNLDRALNELGYGVPDEAPVKLDLGKPFPEGVVDLVNKVMQPELAKTRIEGAGIYEPKPPVNPLKLTPEESFAKTIRNLYVRVRNNAARRVREKQLPATIDPEGMAQDRVIKALQDFKPEKADPNDPLPLQIEKYINSTFKGNRIGEKVKAEIAKLKEPITPTKAAGEHTPEAGLAKDATGDLEAQVGLAGATPTVENIDLAKELETIKAERNRPAAELKEGMKFIAEKAQLKPSEADVLQAMMDLKIDPFRLEALPADEAYAENLKLRLMTGSASTASIGVTKSTLKTKLNKLRPEQAEAVRAYMETAVKKAKLSNMTPEERAAEKDFWASYEAKKLELLKYNLGKTPQTKFTESTQARQPAYGAGELSWNQALSGVPAEKTPAPPTTDLKGRPIGIPSTADYDPNALPKIPKERVAKAPTKIGPASEALAGMKIYKSAVPAQRSFFQKLRELLVGSPREETTVETAAKERVPKSYPTGTPTKGPILPLKPKGSGDPAAETKDSPITSRAYGFDEPTLRHVDGMMDALKKGGHFSRDFVETVGQVLSESLKHLNAKDFYDRVQRALEQKTLTPEDQGAMHAAQSMFGSLVRTVASLKDAALLETDPIKREAMLINAGIADSHATELGVNMANSMTGSARAMAFRRHLPPLQVVPHGSPAAAWIKRLQQAKKPGEVILAAQEASKRLHKGEISPDEFADVVSTIDGSKEPGFLRRFLSLYKVGLFGPASLLVNAGSGGLMRYGFSKPEAGIAAWVNKVASEHKWKGEYLDTRKLWVHPSEFGKSVDKMVHNLNKSIFHDTGKKLIEDAVNTLYAKPLKPSKGVMREIEGIKDIRDDVMPVEAMLKWLGIKKDFGGRVNEFTAAPYKALKMFDTYWKAKFVQDHITREAWNTTMLDKSVLPEQRVASGTALAEKWLTDFANYELGGEHGAVMARAFNYAMNYMFQEKPTPGDFQSSVEKLIGHAPIMELLFPFKRTPFSIFKETLRRTAPWAGSRFKELHGRYTGKGEAVIGKEPIDAQQFYTEQFAKPIYGTMLASLAYMLAKQGLITGSGPTDPKKQQAMKDSGWSPYSLRIPGEGDKATYLGYGRFDPLAPLLGIAADVHEADENGTLKDNPDLLQKLFTSVTENLTNKTFIAGLYGLLEATSDPKRNFPKWARQMQASFMPNMIGWVPFGSAATAIDSTYRKTQAFDLSPWQAKVPFLSKGLEPQYKPSGEERLRSERLGPDVLSPITVTQSGQNQSQALSKEMVNIGYIPSLIKDYTSIHNRKVYYTAAEKKLLQSAANAAAKAAQRLIQDPNYLKLPINAEAAKYPKQKTRKDVMASLHSKFMRQATSQIEGPMTRRAWSNREATVQ